ncbi:MAG TPA: acyl-CoA dehydrogenase C-terminal domain-containing protein [Candidatus Competibacteraceae bacterium]|nr:MAG: acyl-CoA dehydrogenase [Candidatus Competibacteraceae bacterium]HOB60841.1 acyl-CoA dehydrogenase C-terminal domain-containing protein [Candidatus Competibacteraceae bacterium]HQA25146.1 acyl-CoA dehydrogenase C-terminal domain-containing protein [Candidatus Competibacteraceae bacterium]HQD55145.1 acyl-CoA dehydrogenase C-terminal domain-containing protein [Candidatus Competibacteraceae bacterium]
MSSYTAPVRDIQFILHELLKIERYQGVLAGFDEATPETIAAILEGAAQISEEMLLPLNKVGDREGCRLENGKVTTPTGFKDAYAALTEGGWTGLIGDPQYGGQGLPYVLGLSINEIMASANMAFTMYPGLTSGAIEAIEIGGTEAQKALYLPKMIAGQWTGTMNLTEPHCGTDLGLLRTKAEPQADGSYRITGTKIFISAGEHDLTENIVHLVLARIPGGPEGVKGISLFIVPKFLVNPDGSLGDRNAVSCGSLEEKMGIHGNATCVMNYDGAIGYLLGEEHKGLRTMFIMMNAARLGVAVQGVSQAEVAYQNAVAYCRDRLQGRSLRGAKFPDKPADPLIVHPDIRRMLMTARVFKEGARALACWAGLMVDVTRKHPDADMRRKADDLLGLLTPVMKAYFTDTGFTTANLCLQCFGGHGYIAEWGMEQFVRDARIAQIYEGANGIQALDLIGRKLPANKGRAIQLLFAVIGEFCEKYEDNAALSPFVKPLTEALERLVEATQWLMQHAISNPDNGGAVSMDYLYMMALVTLGYQWAQVARVCENQLSNPDDDSFDRAFYQHKLVCAEFFMEKILPESMAHLAKLQAGADSLMTLPADAF